MLYLINIKERMRGRILRSYLNLDIYLTDTIIAKHMTF